MNDLLIILAKLEEKQFAFLRYLILNCNKKGFFEFNSTHYVFDSAVETPNYAIRKIADQLFAYPCVLKKSTVNTVLRPISILCADSTVPLKVKISDLFLEHLVAIRECFEIGLIDNLRKLKSEVAMNIYLTIQGTVDLTEDGVREIAFDTKTTRFSNIIDRKIKPSLVEINSKLGLSTSYSRRKVEGIPIVSIAIN